MSIISSYIYSLYTAKKLIIVVLVRQNCEYSFIISQHSNLYSKKVIIIVILVRQDSEYCFNNILTVFVHQKN